MLGEDMFWPPRPGELWVADDVWPSYGFKGMEGAEVGPGDIILVVEVLPAEQTMTRDGLKETIDLSVIVNGKARFMVSEMIEGCSDMYILRHDRSDINT
jgi:hypothetical protein